MLAGEIILTDDRTGAPFFVVEVSVPDDKVARIRATRGTSGALRPGQPVQVIMTDVRFVVGSVVTQMAERGSLPPSRVSSCPPTREEMRSFRLA